MDSLMCNTLKCRKTLSFENVAVVTSCSHIFCIDCANTLLGSPPSCHICHAKLEDHYDLVQAELHPADLWKSLVLAGLPPPVVIDIASRALSFWNYQQDHEKMYQTVLANHAEKRVAVLEKELTESKRKNEADAEYWRGQVANLGKDLEIEKRKTQQCKELNALNSKAYAKLKSTNEQLKQQILLGTNPMSNASLYYDAPVPTTTHATQASRQPFVPSNNLSSRPQSTSTQQNYSSNDPENYYNDSASTRSFMPNVDQHGQIHGGGKRPHRSSRTKEHQSSDEGSDHRAHNSHSHSHSRSKGHQSHSTQSLAQGIGGVPLGHSAAGGAGVIHGQTPLQHSHAQGQFITSSARRPSSTATYTGQQNFFNQQSAQGVRGGGTVSAGAFRPANFGGRGGAG